MIYNNCEIRKTLKNCLVQLDRLFQWIATVENRPIEKDGTKMGSNFAKYKIVSEYIEFIQPACEAENHFVRKEYPQCAERCRNSMGEFIKYLYTKFRWQKPIGNIKPDEPSLDQLIKDSNIQNYLRQKGSLRYTYSKKSGNNATHQPFYKTDINDAFKCLSDLFYLITKSLPENKFAGTQRFDISLLENCPAELIEPQLTIEINGKEEKIPQNVLLEAVLSKEVSGKLIEENKSLINKTDVLGNTPLSLAVYNNDYETVKTLLENGANPNFYFKNKSVDFHKSVNDEIEKEISQNVSFRNALKEEYKPLISEIENDKILDVLKKTLKEKLWFEYIEAHNCIPLIVAIKKDNKEIVRILLQYSAKTWDICINDYYSIARIPTECSTLLTCAIFYNASSCIDMLLNEDIIDNNGKIIEVPIDPEWGDSEEDDFSQKKYGTIQGVTALMLASGNGNFDVVDQLLEKGARIDITDKHGNSVFLHAVEDKRTNTVLGKLLRTANRTLGAEMTKEILNHPGKAGLPIIYVNEKDADLLFKSGADVNDSCVVDVAHINPELLPWFKSKGAKLDFKTFFYAGSYLDLKFTDRIYCYTNKTFAEILTAFDKNAYISSDDLDFTVPIDNILSISPLVDAILFSKAYKIQKSTKDGKKSEKVFLSDAQLNELHDKYPVIKELSKLGRKISRYSEVNKQYSVLEKWVNEGLPDMGSQKDLTEEEILKLPKHKLDFNIDMTLEEVYKAIASAKELSKAQRIALFEKYPFIKQLERLGIDLNIPEEIESNYNKDKLIQESLGKQINWENTPVEIMTAIRDVKSEIPYEDVEISPLDDALIAKNYDAAAIYLTKEINVSKLTKILLLSVHAISEKDISAWNKVLVALKLCKDIDFSDVLLDLCKNHPKDDFDIAEEFINNGYNFYRFANYNLTSSQFYRETLVSGVSICDYNSHMHFIENEDGTFNMSPSIEDIRKRNNKAFLEQFNETSFQDVNLRLIKNAISFGADIHYKVEKEDSGKTAFDYAKENGIDESLLKVDTSSKTEVSGKKYQGYILGVDSKYHCIKINVSKPKGIQKAYGYIPAYFSTGDLYMENRKYENQQWSQNALVEYSVIPDSNAPKKKSAIITKVIIP